MRWVPPLVLALGLVRAQDVNNADVDQPLVALEDDPEPEFPERCGFEFGGQNCTQDECCSSGGWCGIGLEYCGAPTCQLRFGPACDGNQVPEGPVTSVISREFWGNVSYGVKIYDCKGIGNVALTFDDGPWNYTSDLLDLLQEYNAKATFFVVGTNHGKGFINDPETPWPGLIHRMVDEGHQVASHTWSHQNLTELHETEVKKQMYYNEIALADILGFFPTYMRPPHSMSDERTDSILADLGYHIIYYNINTLAYEYLTPETIQMSKDIWDEDSERVHDDSRSVLLVEHDPIEQTVHNLTRYILDSIQEKGWKPVTVGECLGDPKELWYRAA